MHGATMKSHCICLRDFISHTLRKILKGAKLRNWKITLCGIRIAYEILVIKHGDDKPAETPGFRLNINPYPTAFPYGNGTVLHFYQQQESSTTKTVHKVINRGLKAYV